MTKRKILTLKKTLSLTQEARLSQVKRSSLVSRKKYEQEKNKKKRNKNRSLSNENIKNPTFLRKNRLYEDIGWLINTYPDCFSLKTPKPLKKGIFKDILLQNLWPYSRIRLRNAIAFYTGSHVYQKAILQEDKRCSLEGIAIEDIMEHEREYSKQRLEKFKKKIKS